MVMQGLGFALRKKHGRRHYGNKVSMAHCAKPSGEEVLYPVSESTSYRQTKVPQTKIQNSV
jgi:hypothetical protein